MKRILIVDDSRDVCASLRDAFANEYEVHAAHGGLPALRMIASGGWDGLIVDVDLGPGVSGVVIAERARRQWPNLKIIVFSALDYTQDVVNTVTKVGGTFVEKPIDPEKLRQLLES